MRTLCMKLELDNVSKSFLDVPVVQELSFTVESGQVVGLLGPNGAGKTTTLRMILDILRPDKGKISFDGQKINRKIRTRIGYLPEERGIYQKYRVIDVLTYMARLKNMPRSKSKVEAIRQLDRMNLVDYVDTPVNHLSKGMQQRLQFIVATIHNPDLVILDEPFWGLDPQNQELVREKIRTFRKEGKAILLSTHQLNEAEALCDYFIMLDEGKTVLRGTLDELRKKFHQKIVVVHSPDNLAALREIKNLQKVTVEGNRAQIYLEDNVPEREVFRDIIEKFNVTKLELYEPSLNDIFMQTIHKR